MDAPAMPHAAATELVPQPLAYTLAQRLSGRTRRGDVAQIDIALEAAEFLHCLFDHALADRNALALIAVEQCRFRPAADHRFELPAEIGGIADARIHAEAAVRRMDMGGVAGEEDAALAETIGDQGAPAPRYARHNLEGEIAAHEPADHAIDLARRQGFGVAIHEDAPEAPAIDRHASAPSAFAIHADI